MSDLCGMLIDHLCFYGKGVIDWIILIKIQNPCGGAAFVV
jgi:hypothetical protein